MGCNYLSLPEIPASGNKFLINSDFHGNYLAKGIFTTKAVFSIQVYYYSFANSMISESAQDDIIPWKHFPYYKPSMQESRLQPVDSQHKCPVMQIFNVILMLDWTSCSLKSRFASDIEMPLTLMWYHHNVHVSLLQRQSPYRYAITPWPTLYAIDQ